MPFYVADYLGDTGHLSTIEHGAYLLLIMHYWQNEGLPADETKLARICRLSSREWASARDTLAEFFGEGWSHARIERELCSSRAAYERRAKAGQKGGIAQAMLKRKPSNAEARLKQSQSQPQKDIDPSRERTFPDRAQGEPLSASLPVRQPPDPTGDDAFGDPLDHGEDSDGRDGHDAAGGAR